MSTRASSTTSSFSRWSADALARTSSGGSSASTSSGWSRSVAPRGAERGWPRAACCSTPVRAPIEAWPSPGRVVVRSTLADTGSARSTVGTYGSRSLYRSGSWLALRNRVLAEEPQCRLRLPGCTIWSTHADHIRPMAESGAEFARENVQGVCVHCHRKKTGQEGCRGQLRRQRRS